MGGKGQGKGRDFPREEKEECERQTHHGMEKKLLCVRSGMKGFVAGGSGGSCGMVRSLSLSLSFSLALSLGYASLSLSLSASDAFQLGRREGGKEAGQGSCKYGFPFSLFQDSCACMVGDKVLD